MIRGRPTRVQGTRVLLTRTIAQAVVFWGVFLFVIPPLIAWGERAVGLGSWQFGSIASRSVGAVIFLLASSLGLTSAFLMATVGRGTPLPLDCAPKLVVVGPYAYVRNPMAIAGLAQGVGVGLFLGSPSVLAYVIVGMLVWDRAVRRWEEADLLERFGEAYSRYRREVKCWVPRRTPYRPANSTP